MTLSATYPPMAAPRRRPNSGNLLKRDWNTWPEDSTTRTTCLSSFPTYNCSPFTPYNSMASVSKLVLVPIDMWHRLSKDRKDIDIHSIRTVDIPSSANQSSGTGGSVNALLCQRVQQWWGQALSPLPPFPLPSPKGKKRGRRKGRKGNPCTLIEKIRARRRHPVR